MAYCRVSSVDQKSDLDRQVARVVQAATEQGMPVAEVVTEIGSGLNGRRRKLHRLLADAGFAEVRRQLTYKTAWRGGTLVVADRWFASSKTCSDCGAVKAKLALSERTFVCTECGVVLDRDLNAARNLAALVERHVAGSGSETQNGRGANRETGLASAGGCEASTPHRAGPRVRRGLSPGNGRIIESN